MNVKPALFRANINPIIIQFFVALPPCLAVIVNVEPALFRATIHLITISPALGLYNHHRLTSLTLNRPFSGPPQLRFFNHLWCSAAIIGCYRERRTGPFQGQHTSILNTPPLHHIHHWLLSWTLNRPFSGPAQHRFLNCLSCSTAMTGWYRERCTVPFKDQYTSNF